MAGGAAAPSSGAGGLGTGEGGKLGGTIGGNTGGLGSGAAAGGTMSGGTGGTLPGGAPPGHGYETEGRTADAPGVGAELEDVRGSTGPGRKRQGD
jgi:hypothetical protein